MTKNELNKYKTLLEAKQAELAGGLRNREGIAIEKTADALDEVQLAGERELAIRNLDRESETYRIKDTLFGGETLCLLHEDGPQPLLRSRPSRRHRLSEQFAQPRSQL